MEFHQLFVVHKFPMLFFKQFKISSRIRRKHGGHIPQLGCIPFKPIHKRPTPGDLDYLIGEPLPVIIGFNNM